MDKHTSSMCKDYKKVMTRKREVGATVFLATLKEHKCPTMEEVILHCSKSCRAYNDPCDNPQECKNYKSNRNWKCEIEAKISSHICGYNTAMSHIELQRHKNNATKQPLTKTGRSGEKNLMAALRDHIVMRKIDTQPGNTA